MNYEEMSDKEINKLVIDALGLKLHAEKNEMYQNLKGQLDCNDDSSLFVEDEEIGCEVVDYCNSPSDSWSVIVENKIAILPNTQGAWLSYGWKKWNGKQDFSPRKEVIDKNPLRAAMICFLKMKEV